jgi:hypothetical protein
VLPSIVIMDFFHGKALLMVYLCYLMLRYTQSCLVFVPLKFWGRVRVFNPFSGCLSDWKTCPLHFIFHCKEKDVSLLGYVLSLRPSPRLVY